MRRLCSCAFAFLLLACLSVNQSLACTTFCLKHKGEVLFGKNYDWSIGDGLVVVNKRGVAKTATSEDSPNPAKWTSKYGSVTFNQYGRENPSGGMNEAGLVIELMWLDEAEYPKSDHPTVGTLEWIQYQLDNSATVDEVIKNAEALRIASLVKLHYLVNDKAGRSATIEFLNGKLAAHTGPQLEVATLTNDTYEKSLNYSKQINADVKAKSSSSLDRFARAANRTKEFEKQERSEQEAVDYAFEVLSNVAQEGYTQWSIVYDQKRGKIHFRTRQSPRIKMIDAKAFDYSCGTPVKLFDMNAKDEGDVSAKFTDYTRKANLDLIQRSFSGTDFLKGIPAPARLYVASYPESFTCSSAR